MKLIIDIPDKDYEFIKDAQILIGRRNGKQIEYNMINAIKNGIPLIDVDTREICQTESLLSQYQHNSMSGVFMASPTEVIKTDEPLSNSEEITKAFKNGEIYKRGYKEGYKQAIINGRPQGEWLWVGHDGDKLKWSCSSCGRSVEDQENFCPNCGRPMKIWLEKHKEESDEE